MCYKQTESGVSLIFFLLKKYLKIELSCYLNIINKKNSTDDKNITTNFNQNLILINKKISKEKKYLEEELNKLRIENKNLKKI